ncbi:hypothetical protein LMG28690_06924 [Paraburkholderia caffeinilytica]|nr:hypothetical protein LMG28690_06924 [Paraburkholderia caffeinilytica]
MLKGRSVKQCFPIESDNVREMAGHQTSTVGKSELPCRKVGHSKHSLFKVEEIHIPRHFASHSIALTSDILRRKACRLPLQRPPEFGYFSVKVNVPYPSWSNPPLLGP